MLPRRDHERISDAAIQLYADGSGSRRVGRPAEVDQVGALKLDGGGMIADPDAHRITRAAEVRSVNGNLLAALEGRLLRSRIIDDSPQVDRGWLETCERVLGQLRRSRRRCNQESHRGNRWNHGYRSDPDFAYAH